MTFCSVPSLPEPENAGQTHFIGCWRARGHHNCAVQEINRLLRLAGRLANKAAACDSVDKPDTPE